MACRVGLITVFGICIYIYNFLCVKGYNSLFQLRVFL